MPLLLHPIALKPTRLPRDRKTFDLEFDYQDTKGEATSRRVTVLEVEFWMDGRRPGGGWIHGWCHLRRAMRDFTVERIQRATDPWTGEVMADPTQWLYDHTERPAASRSQAATGTDAAAKTAALQAARAALLAVIRRKVARSLPSKECRPPGYGDP